MVSKTVQFFRRGELVSVQNVPSTRTLLELLREDLACTGTKEGCGEGDCGACTVVVGEALQEGDHATMRYRAVNSCIRFAHSINGLALWTIEDITAPDGTPHPAQQSMMDCHASQCGFCTPGFVMSLFGMYQNHVAQGQPISRELAQAELSGNLCRCTGYRPILEAAQKMHLYPRIALATDVLTNKLSKTQVDLSSANQSTSYMLPQNLNQLLQLRAQHPTAQVVAGCTDIGLWVNKLHMEFPQILDVTRAEELRKVQDFQHHFAVGAAVPLADAFELLVSHWPQLKHFAQRFAGLPVRNSGTLGGNIANGSPIGDSMPLLIALGANLVLARWHKGAALYRELPLDQFYSGYRKTVLRDDEILVWIKIPKPVRGDFLRVYKVSKRYDDDISAVCLAINLRLEHDIVISASIGVGGVSATPARASKTEATLRNQPWNEHVAKQTAEILQAEFTPISDMRASAQYRKALLGNLVRRFWLEIQGMPYINLEGDTFLESL